MINAVSYQFNKFVEFAKERVEAGKESAIARTGEVRIGAGTPLEERAIYSTDKTDFVGMTLLRTKDAKRSNDEVRELFRKSIAEMFGGEGNIPDSVKDAMLLKDFGSGKPLTARRILEVKNAIEDLHRVNIFGSETDPEGALAQIALNAVQHGLPSYANGKRLRGQSPEDHLGKRVQGECRETFQRGTQHCDIHGGDWHCHRGSPPADGRA